MIPLTEFQHDTLIDFLPTTLPTTVYPLIETARNIPRPECPAIVVWSSSFTPSDGAYSFLRNFRNRDGEMVEYWGERYFFTLNCSLRAYSPVELAAMLRSFLQQIQRDRRDMKMRWQTIEFKEVLRAETLPDDIERDSSTGQRVFRAVVDLKFEFEISEPTDEDLILKYYHEVYLNDMAPEDGTPLEFYGECSTVELPLAINAAVEVESTLEYEITAIIEAHT